MNQLELVTSVLPQAEIDKLNPIKEELIDAWHKRQVFRTATEARYGVLNDHKFPTNASKYWQCVREQMVHFDELTTLTFELRRKKINLKEIDHKLSEKDVALTEFDRDRLLIDRDECLFHLASGEQVAKDRVREVMQWSELKNQFNDGSFDTKSPNTHQAQSLFRSVLNRAMVAPKDISAEERLSIGGLLEGMKDMPGNRELYDKYIGVPNDRSKINGAQAPA